MKQVVCLALLFSLLFAGCFATDCDVSSTNVLTGNTGTLGCLDPTGYNIDIIWEIQPNNGSISLTFDFINFDFLYDELTIKDGDYEYSFTNSDVTSYQSLNDKLQIVYYSDFVFPLSVFSISYVALGDPCLYSVSRTIDNSPQEITCNTLAASITSSWSVVTELPAVINFSTTGDVTLTIRDGPSALDPIIYQGSDPSPLFGSLYSSKPNFYVEVSSVNGGTFDLFYYENDFCIGGGNTFFTAPGTVTCSGGGENSLFIFPPTGQAVEFQITELALSFDYVYFYDGTGENSYSLFDSNLPPVVVAQGDINNPYAIFFYFSLSSEASSFSISYRFVTNPCSAAGVLTLSNDVEAVSCYSSFDTTYESYEAGYLIDPQNEVDIVALDLTFLRGSLAFNIFEGTSANGGLLYAYAGDGYNVNGNFYSTGPMYIQLLVDAQDDYYYGFEYEIQTVLDPCLQSADTYRYALFGTISCPSLPSNLLTSNWFIFPDQGQISIEFNEFDLDVGSALKFFDYNTEELLYTFTSASVLKDFTTAATALVVELDIAGVAPELRRGPPFTFSITYTAAASACLVSTDLLLIDETATFGCGSGFGPNLHSTWLIAPHNGQIEYTVTKLKLLSGFPGLFINIYDGYNNTGLLLKTIIPGEHYVDPENSSPYYYSNGYKISGLSVSDAIFVEFYSDSHTPSQGLNQYFEIEYSTLGDICGSSLEAVLTEPKGVFGCATGLNDNIKSTWLISPQNDEITLVFLKLDLEDGFDFVEIFDGSGPNSPSLGKFTGDTIPSPNFIKSSSDSLYVVVTTDPSSNSGGFEFAYLSGVGNPCLSDYNVTLTNDFGEFGCANGIQNDIHSFWTITVPTDQGAVVASFTEFSLQLDNDFLYVYDGDSSSAKLLATLTGSNLPADITSSGRSLYFLLVTDKSIRSQGFYVKYTSVQSDPCQTNQFTQLSKNADSFGCSEGSIAPEITSKWLILPNNRNIITLSFSVFNLRAGDFVRVYDGDNDSNTPLLGSFTGSTVPSFVVSTGSAMFVVLETGVAGQSVGFRASYTTNQADSCATSTENTLVASTGNLGCPNGVRKNVQSSWLIAPLSNNRIEITIEFVDLAVGATLTIYDGSSDQASILVQYTTGIATFKTVTSSHSVALVVISTFGNSESNGFSINYVTAIPPSPSLRPFVPSASRTPIDFSFTPSPSLVPVTPSQTPVTLTPWVIAPSTTRSISVAPSPSTIVGSTVPSVTSTHSETNTRSALPSPVIATPSSSSSNFPQFSITPFSPSANPSVSTTANPIRVISDVETLTVQLECRTSGATCCNNFETVWASTEENNYPTLIDVNSCIYNDGTVTVKFDQYGSNHFSSDEIIRNYWDDGGCSRKDPFTGEECSVSTSALDTNIWRTQIMVVNSIPATPSPLPSYYYYAASSTSESSVLSGLVSLLFVALTILYLAF